ncbi:phosphoribosyltransferase [Mangrovimonas aestuarii]|uniref:phosphoribosyltransferase n=1 Tax=Mangrovimonas aestuarii TaxID=3018443 RepID=UPI002378AEA0|nr:phosphoribosyltransferase family protein [Mangrovimonas aestuarii]
MFKNRDEAGMLLADRLSAFKDANAVVLAIPRGGLPIGAIIAKQLNLPLEVVLTKKIGHPYNREYAIGAVSLNSLVLGESATDIPERYIQKEAYRIRETLKKRQKEYYRARTPIKIKDKIAIVVDDGIATGNTILATIALIAKEEPKQIIIAIPVSSVQAIKKLNNSPSIHSIICLEVPSDFHAVGNYYEDFSPVTDVEAINILKYQSIT